MRRDRTWNRALNERFSRHPELGRLYRERKALKEVDSRTCIAPEWCRARILKLDRAIDDVVARINRGELEPHSMTAELDRHA